MSWGDMRQLGLRAQGQDWVALADEFRRADVRVYNFEEEKLVTYSKERNS